MTSLISSYLDCEIIHILGENKEVTYLDKTSVNEYDMALKFNSNQLDCELELNESFTAENKFKLIVWNIPSATLIVTNDIVRLSFNWEHNNADKYYTECTITIIVPSIESDGTKTTIEGTFVYYTGRFSEAPTSFLTSHSKNMTWFEPDTTYYLRITAIDRFDNQTISEYYVATTL